MSKQRRTQDPEHPAPDAQSQRDGPDTDFSEQDEIGNMALVARMAAPTPEVDAPLELIRDVAVPLLERAILALQVYPQDEAEVARYVSILEGSSLAPDRKEELIDKLASDQAGAEMVRDAVEASFLAHDEATRSALVTSLDLVWASLTQGGPSSDGRAWQHGENRRELTGDALHGAVSSRAEAMVAHLVNQELPGASFGDKSAGDAVVGFSQKVLLALRWDEEEEEEGEWFVEPEVM